jgi:DNA helicase-2/ATP-dependent DNA helicase PcrA
MPPPQRSRKLEAPRLDEAQREAVNHRKGPGILLAGPGAGKTAVLTQRAAALVAEGTPARRVLLLTFTRNSAKEMMDRARALEPRCEDLSGGTFHSLATRIINRNAHVFGMEREFTILDPDDERQIVQKVMEPLKRGLENWPPPKTVTKVISFSTNTRCTIEEAVERLSPKHVELVAEFQEVRDRYVRYKLEKGMLCYDDCLEYFLALLEDEEIGALVRADYDYMMFDEYQDTNALQLAIVYALAGEKNNVMVVGDPAQAIYGFRGAAPETMLNFRKRFPESRIIKLETNYRSSAEIVALVNAIDQRTGSGFQRTLRSHSGESGLRPVFMESPNSLVQASEIGDSILRHKDEGGLISDVAILVRSMSFARRIEVELTTRKIPYRVVGGLKIDEAAHVKDLLSLARVATNPQHEPAWLRLLMRYRGIGDVSGGKIAERLIDMTDVDEMCALLDAEAQRYKTHFLGLSTALRALMDPSKEPVTALGEAALAMDPVWSAIPEWAPDWADRQNDIEAVIGISADHKTLDSFLTAITLDYSVDQKKKRSAEKDEEMPVTISTVHGAKGLEWPIVHIPSFHRGHMPSFYANEPEEEARIVYVALSRARRELVIHKPRMDDKDGFIQQSEFESLIRSRCTTKRATARVGMGAPVATTRRIDMAARLLKKN